MAHDDLVIDQSHWGPTEGWDDEFTSVEDTSPIPTASTSYLQSVDRTQAYVGRECDQNDVVLIGNDGGESWCSSAVVQLSAPLLAEIISNHDNPSSSGRITVQLPYSTEKLRYLVEALEFKTCVKIPWSSLTVHDLIDVTQMLRRYDCTLWCGGTIEQRIIDLLRRQNTYKSGRFEGGDLTHSRIYNFATSTDFDQLKMLCESMNPQYASSSHLLHEGDDRPRKRRMRI